MGAHLPYQSSLQLPLFDPAMRNGRVVRLDSKDQEPLPRVRAIAGRFDAAPLQQVNQAQPKILRKPRRPARHLWSSVALSASHELRHLLLLAAHLSRLLLRELPPSLCEGLAYIGGCALCVYFQFGSSMLIVNSR
jgi:hypothetical protein